MNTWTNLGFRFQKRFYRRIEIITEDLSGIAFKVVRKTDNKSPFIFEINAHRNELEVCGIWDYGNDRLLNRITEHHITWIKNNGFSMRDNKKLNDF